MKSTKLLHLSKNQNINVCVGWSSTWKFSIVILEMNVELRAIEKKADVGVGSFMKIAIQPDLENNILKWNSVFGLR